MDGEISYMQIWHQHVLSAQSCLTLCDPIDCSLPGSSVHGILQARILGWVAIPFSRGSSQPRDRTPLSHIAGRFFTVWATWEVCGVPCYVEWPKRKESNDGGQTLWSFFKVPHSFLTWRRVVRSDSAASTDHMKTLPKKGLRGMNNKPDISD